MSPLTTVRRATRCGSASRLARWRGETDWFDLGVTITVEGHEVPFTDLFVALNRNHSHLLLADGAYFSLEKPELLALRRLIDEARALQDNDRTARLRISRFQAGLWEEFAALGVVGPRRRRGSARSAACWRSSSIEPQAAARGAAARLRPYQADGFGWLAFLWEHQLGGILADDMGLGKTLQSLALICHAQQAQPGLASVSHRRADERRWRTGSPKPPGSPRA